MRPRASATSLAYTPSPLLKNGGLWYPGRHWINVFPGNATFTSDSFDYIDARTSFFTYAYSASPGMAASMDNVGAKYPATFVDADGDLLQGGKTTSCIYRRTSPLPSSGR